jgi:hypothetical protein
MVELALKAFNETSNWSIRPISLRCIVSLFTFIRIQRKQVHTTFIAFMVSLQRNLIFLRLWIHAVFGRTGVYDFLLQFFSSVPFAKDRVRIANSLFNSVKELRIIVNDRFLLMELWLISF